MGVVSGTRYSTSDSANVGIDMSDTLTTISPSEIPLLQLVGKDSLSSPCVATKHEWLEDALRGIDGAVANDASLNNVTDPVAFNVVAGQGVLVATGDILLVESEQLRVTGVATDAVTVARGFGGSTNVAHAANTPWKIIGNVFVQDAAVTTSRTTTKSGLFNYTQIMQDAVKFTTTEQAIKKYVEQNSMDAQMARAMKTWWILWERALIYGRKVQPTATVAGAMDGILTRLVTNAYAKAGAYLIEDHLRTALRDVWQAGGNPTHLFLNSFQKERVNQILDSLRQTSRTDTTAGSVIKRYESEYGDVDIVLDRNMPADTVLVISKEHLGFGPLAGHATKAIEIPVTTGLVRTFQVFGQYTSETRAEPAHAKITGLATS